MGAYLNSKKPHMIYKDVAHSTYFVDKTAMLEELIPLVEADEQIAVQSSEGVGKDNKYICITRPRRFGKTVMASMIASFFGKGRDSRKIFEKLKIGSNERFESHLNQHNVIYIAFNEIPDGCKTYAQYIVRIKQRILNDLQKAFPEADIDSDTAVWDAFNNIYEWEEDVQFIFVLDEWDYGIIFFTGNM